MVILQFLRFFKIFKFDISKSFWSISKLKPFLKSVNRELSFETVFGARFKNLKWRILIGQNFLGFFYFFFKNIKMNLDIFDFVKIYRKPEIPLIDINSSSRRIALCSNPETHKFSKIETNFEVFGCEQLLSKMFDPNNDSNNADPKSENSKEKENVFENFSERKVFCSIKMHHSNALPTMSDRKRKRIQKRIEESKKPRKVFHM